MTKAPYRILLITKEFEADGFETVTDPHDAVTSPTRGRHSDGTTSKTTIA